MFNLSNGLSLLRAPLALCFLSGNIYLRISSIVLAMITDHIDGFLARRQKSVTQIGAILDPTMDKLFVFIVLFIFLKEKQIHMWQICAMLSRDFSLCVFGVYLYMSKKWQSYRFKSIRWGKATTLLQFILLFVITIQVKLNPVFYLVFVILGMLAFLELFSFKRQSTQ